MTHPESFDYLSDRAAAHGGTIDQLLSVTPAAVADCPLEAAAFWEQRDASHIFSQSEYPELAHDWNNIIPEDPTRNRSRGADTMNMFERLQTSFDNHVLAMQIDADMDCDDAGFV